MWIDDKLYNLRRSFMSPPYPQYTLYGLFIYIFLFLLSPKKKSLLARIPGFSDEMTTRPIFEDSSRSQYREAFKYVYYDDS